MNNKEFTTELSKRLSLSTKETSVMLSALIHEFSNNLEEGNSISIQGFGSFEVKKKLERVVINPASHQRMLVPPKMEIKFKPSPLLKDKIN